MGMAGHAQAKKNRNFFKNLHRLKMVQFAKLTCLNRQIPIFWKFSLLQGVYSPDLVIFSHKKNRKVNFFSSIQNGPIRKVDMFKPPNSNILKIFPFTGCLQPRLSHFLKKKVHFHWLKMSQCSRNNSRNNNNNNNKQQQRQQQTITTIKTTTTTTTTAAITTTTITTINGLISELIQTIL